VSGSTSRACAIGLRYPALAEKRFIIYSDGDNILLKPVKREIPEFKKLMKQIQKLADEAGLTEDDIVESIKAVRRKNHETCCDFIVSGDKDLLVLNQYENIKIVTIWEFLDINYPV
jgi:5'-3' exonuclease